MKKILLSSFLILGMGIAKAQIHEIGVFGGGTNYIGDVGTTDYIAPKDLAVGVLYKWNKSTRHAYRASFTQAKISGNDLDAKAPNRNQRGYSFENNIKEVSLGLEFNFFDFNLHGFDNTFTPYLYSGLSYFNYKEQYIQNGNTLQDGNHYALAIPMTLGVKAKISRRFVLGAEVGVRYTFTDNLDGSSPKDSFYETLRFGNLNSNDWYVFSGVTLTYTFGKNPCYCPY